MITSNLQQQHPDANRASKKIEFRENSLFEISSPLSFFQTLSSEIIENMTILVLGTG
jgi:hypothetical protein